MKIEAAGLAALLELVSRSLHSLGHSDGLFPSQWAALRYLARAPEEERTSSHLARFQGLSNGPVSRTVRTLIAKGLIGKSARQPKGRAEWLDLTPAGRMLLENDPLKQLEAALTSLSEADRLSTARVLDRAIRTLSQIETHAAARS